jgi:sugar phosphate permease
LSGAAALAGAPTLLLVPVLLVAGVLAMSWNGLSFTAAAEMSGRERAGTAIGVQNSVLSAAGVAAPVAFAAIVAALSWPVAWLALAASQVAGVHMLTPLVGEEEGRRSARRARLQAAARAPSRTSPRTLGELT